MRMPSQAACWSLVAVFTTVAASGQESQGSASNPFGESIEVAVANVEVYVDDKSGRPVKGLSAEDFELFEDGEPVLLTNFYAVDSGRRVLSESGSLDGAEAEKGDQLPSSLVIYIDNANLSAFHRNRALEQVKKFLRERLDRGDRAMLVAHAGEVSIEVGLTDSMRELASGLDRLSEMSIIDLGPDARRRRGIDELLSLHLALAGSAGTAIVGEEAENEEAVGNGELGGSSFGAKPCEQQLGESARIYARAAYDNVKRSVEHLEQFTHTLSGLPGRKALLYVSDGLPMIPGEEAFELLSQLCGGAGVTSGVRDGVFDTSLMNQNDKLNYLGMALEGLSFNAASLYRSLTNSANANQVTFFTLEAAGPRQGGSASAEHQTMLSSLQSVDSVALKNLQDSLFSMAEETGGRAVLNTADLGAGLSEIAADLDTYYSLGYRPQGRRAGEATVTHKLEVKVRRPGVRVRARKSFAVKDSRALMADRTLGTLIYGVEENPLRVEVRVGSILRLDDELHSVPVQVRVPLSGLVFLLRDGQHHAKLSVQVAARDRQGRLAPVRSAEIPLAIPEARLAEARSKSYVYEVKMLMREGEHSVAVGLRDELGQETSFVLADVPVGAPAPAVAAAPATQP